MKFLFHIEPGGLANISSATTKISRETPIYLNQNARFRLLEAFQYFELLLMIDYGASFRFCEADGTLKILENYIQYKDSSRFEIENATEKTNLACEYSLYKQVLTMLDHPHMRQYITSFAEIDFKEAA